MDNKKVILGIGVLVFLLIALIILWPVVTVGAGERGVVMNFGKVQDQVLDEGIHFRTPIVQSVKKISVRVQKNDVKAEAASNDLQDVSMDVVVNYHIDPKRVNKVYQSIGDNEEVFNRIVAPNTNEVVKASTAQYKAEKIIQLRQELKNKIDVALLARLKDYDIILDDVSLTNIDFSQEFNSAIEAKQVAQLESQKAQFIAEKAIKEADAAVNKAKGESEAQRLQQQTLNPDLLYKLWIEKWNGVLPSVVSENSQILQLPIK